MAESYTCPSCGAPLAFSTKTQNWVCEFCDSAFDLEALQQKKKSQEWTEHEEVKWEESEKEQIRAYNCSSCGAEIVTDTVTAATFCPYCGNPTILPDKLSGDYKPDFVLPFKNSKEEAIEQYKQFCKKKILLPNSFLKQNTIEKISGVYVPFWLFDCKADGDYAYDAQKITSRRSGDYEITTTRHFLVKRKGSLSFEKIPCDGSSNMDDALMDSIEPYDYSEMKPFAIDYLSGFLAQKYDVKASDNSERANARVKSSLESKFQQSLVGYSAVFTQKEDVSYSENKVSLGLLPVWMLNTKYKGKNYTFAMNGQTKKVVANLPMSLPKFFGGLFGLSAIIGAIIFFILHIGGGTL